ncbi:abhydrolase domain-containing protein 4-like [Tropilaelaps mercedesae]|uniref:Abhydrolase domain-containing protein 4-like n=1 Tax=Tropilaelaps mercedesae TaxID=418985 RepID=A0A1V9X3F7_9ACAR|nr:abhydrolase domain-containing protein 4-like [Tropilaelaps mercedesae]
MRASTGRTVSTIHGHCSHNEEVEHPYLEAFLALFIWMFNIGLSIATRLTPRWIRWCPTSPQQLVEVERRMLKHLQVPFELRDVTIDNCTGGKTRHRIRTFIIRGAEPELMPLVLLHGFGSGLGMWALNFDELSQSGRRSVYAIDMLGFGSSSRPRFASDAAEVETQFMCSVEKWRQAVDVRKAIFVGHALGGFIASGYALKHPDRVAHLVLVDPWGLPERSSHTERHLVIPSWAKMAVNLLHPFNPLGILRAAGPLGPQLVRKFRPDLRKKFDHVISDRSVVPSYIYHVNAQNPSGEAGFRCMMNSLGWARHPMLKRMAQIRPSIAITFVYGSRSWVDKGPGVRVKHMRPHSPTEVEVVEGAGHHVYGDKPDEFNKLVIAVAEHVDASPDHEDALAE